MNKKRDSLEIIYDILKFIADSRGKAKPTHILYKSNLSHQMLTDYIKDLTSKGLITEELVKNKKVYSLTSKGYAFVEDFSVIKKFMTSYGFD